MRHCKPLNQAAAMFKLSDQSDPDLQRYLRYTYTDRYTDRQRFLAFIERCIGYIIFLQINLAKKFESTHACVRWHNVPAVFV